MKIEKNERKLIMAILFAAIMIASAFTVIPTVTAQNPEYYVYADFNSTNTGGVYTPGQGVGGYATSANTGMLYVATNYQDCYVYEVSIPPGSDPNDHLNCTGEPMAPRTLTFVESHDILTDMQVPSISQSASEFYINDSCIFYGPSVGGVHYWAKNASGTFGAYLGKIVDVNLYAQTLAYDDGTNTWYAGLGNREIYSFGPEDIAWQLEFDYTNVTPPPGPGYSGSHHDGLVFAGGSLWVSDMTSNYIGQWENTSEGPYNGWNETNLFVYAGLAVDDDVEGMGFGPLGHLWATGWNRLYELGCIPIEQHPLWHEINKELVSLKDNVSAAPMPNIIKNRLIDKLEYAEELKHNAKIVCEEGNFDGATKKLGVAKSQVESFASMVKITRRISAADKASFLAESAEIIGKIDELIDYIEIENGC